MLSSFLIYFHSFRIDNLLQTIRLLERNDPEVVAHSELILLCQNQIGSIKSKFTSTQTINLNLPNFQKSKAVNHGAKLTKSNKIVVLDSDRVLPPGYFLNVLTTLQPKTVVTTAITHRLNHAATDQEINNTPFKLEPRKRSNAFCGSPALHLSDYWTAGGMNEEYVGYGWEDDDMSQCLLKTGIRLIFRDEIEIHLYHSRHTYGTSDQKALYLRNGIRFHSEWKLPIEDHLQEELNNYTKNLV